MKTLLSYSIAIILLALSGCSKVVMFEPSDEEIASYSSIYMPRAIAERAVTTTAMSTTGEEKTFLYNAYFGGPENAKENIDVTFAIDPAKVAEFNSKNGTNYKLLPEIAYSIETLKGTINAGGRSTGDLKVTVTPGDYFTLFETYLLPISLVEASGTVAINEKLTTSYLVFNITYLPGQVPRERVLQLGQNWGTILTNGARGSLIRKDNKNDIVLHEPDAEGKFTAPARVIGVNWEASESFYYVNENSVVVRNFPYWAGLFSFRIDANHELPQANPFWLGDFWDKYKIIPFKEYFLTVDNEGIMRRQPVLTDVNAPKTQVAIGFNIYKQIITYKNFLLASEENGKLWIFPMSEDGVPGTRRQVGEGWDVYEKIIASGDDILALDDQGDVYRYKFNPNGFYPLK